MSVKTILDDIAKAPLTVLKWLASSQGQALTGVVETGVETVFPLATSAINIFNKYVTEAIKVQALSLGAAPGSVSIQKAAAVVNSIGPEIVSFAQANGMAAPTAAELLTLNNLAVQFLNTLRPAGTPAPATTSQTVGASTITATKVG